jgi:O-acetyl-ADP-ribose deacetylase (regulator of RNase III)
MPDDIPWLGRTIRLVQADITALDVDVIVNAASPALRGGGGVVGAIHAAAGPDQLAELVERYPTGTPTGSAVLTGPGRLHRLRAIVHAVGPVWRGGDQGEPGLLADAHRSAMDLAASVEARSVAFPAISQGIYGYPTDRAAPIAVTTVTDWLSRDPDTTILEVIFVLRGDPIVEAYRAALATLSARA